MATDATEHFHHSSEWHVVICKECQYAVWPNQIVGHLTNKQHALPRKIALSISDEIEQWPGIALFPNHSQYFEVQSTPDTDRRGISRSQAQETWSQVRERACSHYDEIRASDIIRPGEADEVNPWLKRAGWLPYLEGFSSRDILRLIEEPADDEAVLLSQVDESDTDVFRERVAAVIWHAVADVARISQETVSQSGV
ncbi:hypothetical protein KC340_g18885, partial [Hortaea werneckii]